MGVRVGDEFADELIAWSNIQAMYVFLWIMNFVQRLLF